MSKGNLSFVKDSKNKEDCFKVKKRKFSLINDESASKQPSGVHETFKKPLIEEDFSNSSKDIPKVLHYKSSDAYTKIVAKPGSLPNAPEVFQSNLNKNEVTDSFNSFLEDLLTTKSFNTDVNDRFSNALRTNSKKKKKEKKKIKKVKKEKPLEEKLRRAAINKEKWEKKKLKKKEQKELQTSTNSEEDFSVTEETQSIKSRIDIFKAIKKKALIFHMHYPNKFSFLGEIKITVITGEVEVLGYTLSKNSADAYSPDFCTPLVAESKPVSENRPLEEIKMKLLGLISDEDCKTILTNFEANDSIILVEQIISTFGIVINKYFERPLFPKDFDDLSSEIEMLKKLKSVFTFHFPKKGKYFRKSPQWDKIPLGHCTTLCGGKGVGKSTLLKYYINKLVSLGEKVLCLDFDPGQSEFTFPGCLSAVVIDQPLLGPNFTHVMDPVIMSHFGDIEVTQNPLKYMECVRYIIEYCRNNEELLKMKWFVNTMGFCKGLGVNLMITILRLLNPNTVIQIKGSNYKNNYPFYLTPTTVNSKSGFRAMPLDDVVLLYDLRVIHSCAELKKKQLQGGLKQRQLRDLMAISYFSKMVSSPFYNFNAVQPFVISFSKLYLGIDFFIDLGNVLKAFNGNTVSLSHIEPDTENILSVESEEDVYFKVVVKPKVTSCLGIGFVRGIDCQEKKFYVMTHLTVEALNNVNCLSLGRVSPPHSMFLKQEAVEGKTIYTTLGSLDVIQRVKRIFRVPATPQNKENYST